MPSKEVPWGRGSRFQVIPRAFTRDPLGFVTRESAVTGDFFRIRLFNRIINISTNVEVIRHVLQVNHRNYRKGPLFRHLSLFLGEGLLTSEGERWRRQRQMIQPAFHKSQLPAIFQIMTQTAEGFCAHLEKRAGEGPVDISREMMQATADIVLHALFSATMEKDREEIYQFVMEAQNYSMYMTTHPWMVPFMRLSGRRRAIERQKAYFDEWIYRLIRERRHSHQRPADLLTMLVEASDEEGDSMPDEQLRDEAITIFAAGHETSANALTWTLLLLARHPEIYQKLKNEADTVLEGRTPVWEDLPNLVYTRQVMEEGMRLYPPAHAFGRIALASDEVAGHRIGKGETVFISVYALHRDPCYWPDPERFDPDRFAPGREQERPRLAYMPFGAGPRMCIGNNFALVEIQLLLALLVQRFQFELAPGQDIAPEPLVTLKPRSEVRMRLRSTSPR